MLACLPAMDESEARHESKAGGPLFEELRRPEEEDEAQAQAERQRQRRRGPARLLRPDRTQVELRAVDLESLLPDDHQARLVWGYVEQQDLSRLDEAIKARGSMPGRRAIDPRVLFALWLYATLDGVGSGREIARLSQTHDAYRWLCGGVSVNYHALNDFRAGNAQLFDELLSVNVAALAAAGVITLKRVAQDGVRVRANAGAASFRRRERLHKQLTLAQELVRSLKDSAAADPGAASRRQQAARERAAQQRQQSIEAALARLPELAAAKQRKGGKGEDARASTTDAQASVMKMADGGFRPAYNVQYATDCAAQAVVGVEVVTAGSDMAQLAPMVEQVEQRLGRAPEQWLVDGGFPAHEQIDAVADKTTLYAPVPKARTAKDKAAGAGENDDGAGDKGGKDNGDNDSGHGDGSNGAMLSAGQPDPNDGHRTAPQPAGQRSEFEPRPSDSPAVAQWRARMATPEAREIYKDRAANAECVNAQVRNRGLQRMPVRGLLKAKAVALLHALAHNLTRMIALAPALLGRPAMTLAATACRA
jgi:transposase